MSSGAIQQRQTQMGALVPVDQRTSAGPKSASTMSLAACFIQDNGRTAPCNRAGSAFLVQLAQQYETKREAHKRRRETRHTANQRYDQPLMHEKSRHLVWV